MANPFSDAPSMDDMITNWGNSINDSAPIVSSLFSSLFTIMFLVGVVRLGYSIVTKTGQVMKGATGVLIWAPISFFIIRIF